MSLRVVGAGLPRTGTASLKLALEELLGGPCYHMSDVFANPGHIPVWHDAVRGQPPSWQAFFDGYRAAVDLPAAAFWQEIAAANPGALILLSVRDSPGQWWESVTQTMLDPSTPRPAGPGYAEYGAMMWDLWSGRLGIGGSADTAAAMAAYQRHNDRVRALAPPGQLLMWRPADGWEPIATALGLPVPAEPFPHVNTRAQFRVPELGTRLDADWREQYSRSGAQARDNDPRGGR